MALVAVPEIPTESPTIMDELPLLPNWPITTWLGDGAHILGLFILVTTIIVRRNCKGVSGKSQLLLAFTYALRYIDLSTNLEQQSAIFIATKLYFILTSFLLVHLIYSTFRESYEQDKDNFPLSYLVVPVTFFAFLINHSSGLTEICWTWSIYMEVVALIPQFYVTWNGGSPPISVLLYVFLMVVYRALHIPRWVHEFGTTGTWDPILTIGGIVQIFVNGLGFVTLVALRLQRSSCYRSQKPSIWLLPEVAQHQQIGPHYKPLMSSKFDFADEEDELFVRSGNKYSVPKLSPQTALVNVQSPR